MKLKSPLVVLLASVAPSGCHRVDSDSPKARHRATSKEMLRTSGDMDGILRGRLPFDAERFCVGSARLHQLTGQPWQYSPSPKADRGDEDTCTKDEVWQRQQEFKAATQVFIDTIDCPQDNTHQATLTSGDVRKDFTVVRDAYEACHRKFYTL